MSEELQSLLERIEKDGVAKANAQADDILNNAKTKAAKLIEDAEAKAAQILEKAESDSKVFEARSAKALEQAARDTVLSVESAVTAIFDRIAGKAVAESLDLTTVQNAVAALIDGYIKADAAATVTLSEAQRAGVTDYLAGKFQALLNEGLTIEGSSSIASGFKVTLTKDHVEHDFTGKAVADALATMIRPELAKIVKGTIAS